MGYKFLDFSQSINDQLEKSLVEVLRSGFWSTGPQSKLLEDTLSQRYKRPCITTSSGGTALQTLSLLFPEIKRIAVQTNTYFASCLPWVTSNKEIILLGSSQNLLMPDISIIKDALNHQPDAIILTHIGGYPNPDILEISNLCKQKGVILIEDCAHSPFVSIDDQYVGTFGDAAILSFFPTKPIPAGEGGVVILKDHEKAEQARRLRDYGKYTFNGKLHHSLPALPNARMNDFSATIANVIIDNYKSIIQHKKELAKIYDSKLSDYSFENINYTKSDVSPSYYKYICFVSDSSIKTSPVYDHANQISSILDENGYPYTFVGETRSWTPHVCLPLTPSMSKSDIYNVISSICNK
tara:strand:- start:1799 stop:2857 length:1059 start_codon:yes stop_codon:yes gene_type:complete